MNRILDEIRSGAFAREWLGEKGQGASRLQSMLETADRHPIEEARRRALGASSKG
jgi:ketol-acid reductoisomerase